MGMNIDLCQCIVPIKMLESPPSLKAWTVMCSDQYSALSYVHSLFSNELDWYKNADLKAQVLLTLDAAFLSFIAGSVFVKADDLNNIIDNFGGETWAFVAGMVVSLLGSIYTALACMRSRLAESDDIRNHLEDIAQDAEFKLQQKPETMWFFGHIAQLEDRKRFQKRIEEFSKNDEIAALSSSIFVISRNVLRKHEWVNRGFLLAAVTLTLFLAAAVSYVIRISLLF